MKSQESFDIILLLLKYKHAYVMEKKNVNELKSIS